MPDIIRYFVKDVESRLRALETLDEDIEVTELGYIEFERGAFRYPIHHVLAERPGENEKHDVLLSAGIHGDEPSGVYALLDFLDRHVHEYLGVFRFHIFPCINPSGFEFNKHENLDGVNINGEFPGEVILSREAVLVKDFLGEDSQRFAFTMDFHNSGQGPEDDFDPAEDPTEFYMYELCNIHEYRVGTKIVKAHERDRVPICRWPKIYSDTTNGNGVIWYPEGRGSKRYVHCLDYFLYQNHTNQAFTIETPLNWPLEECARVQLKSLLVALDEIGSRLG
ncbi:succinylglutamate desuccinylase/aspartoacylase family protein [Candidatus Woesearchaeota archaeon]|nr:succinylglutamate desuccinylase/aspartoacylase family protein [Candidatus Woesearchaeota archaeon]